MAALVAMGMVTAAITLSTLLTIPMLGLQSDVDGMPTIIIATATYLGALFGFLQAVTIFAVQLRSQQDTSMLALTPLIARRYFTFLILGAIAGVTIANLLAALSAPVFPISRSALGALSLVNVLAVPGATLAAFWYLAKIVSEAGEADMDVALPVLRAVMRSQTWADARQVAMLNEYISCLDKAGVEYDPFANSRFWSADSTTISIAFNKPGVSYDLDCHRLDRLAHLVRSATSSPAATVTVTIGHVIQSNDALVLSWRAPAAPTASTAPTPTTAFVSEELQSDLHSILAGAFLVRRGVKT